MLKYFCRRSTSWNSRPCVPNEMSPDAASIKIRSTDDGMRRERLVHPIGGKTQNKLSTCFTHHAAPEMPISLFGLAIARMSAMPSDGSTDVAESRKARAPYRHLSGNRNARWRCGGAASHAMPGVVHEADAHLSRRFYGTVRWRSWVLVRFPLISILTPIVLLYNNTTIHTFTHLFSGICSQPSLHQPKMYALRNKIHKVQYHSTC